MTDEPFREGSSEGQPSRAVGLLVVGARVELRKPHACGALEWTIHRVGAEVGLTCASCGRRVLLARAEAERRIRRYLAV
jgi:hypothetical protein